MISIRLHQLVILLMLFSAGAHAAEQPSPSAPQGSWWQPLARMLKLPGEFDANMEEQPDFFVFEMGDKKALVILDMKHENAVKAKQGQEVGPEPSPSITDSAAREFVPQKHEVVRSETQQKPFIDENKPCEKAPEVTAHAEIVVTSTTAEPAKTVEHTIIPVGHAVLPQSIEPASGVVAAAAAGNVSVGQEPQAFSGVASVAENQNPARWTFITRFAQKAKSYYLELETSAEQKIQRRDLEFAQIHAYKQLMKEYNASFKLLQQAEPRIAKEPWYKSAQSTLTRNKHTLAMWSRYKLGMLDIDEYYDRKMHQQSELTDACLRDIDYYYDEQMTAQSELSCTSSHQGYQQLFLGDINAWKHIDRLPSAIATVTTVATAAALWATHTWYVKKQKKQKLVHRLPKLYMSMNNDKLLEKIDFIIEAVQLDLQSLDVLYGNKIMLSHEQVDFVINSLCGLPSHDRSLVLVTMLKHFMLKAKSKNVIEQILQDLI